MSRFTARTSLFAAERSLRFIVAVLPRSRLLKWLCPEVRWRSFFRFVVRKRFAVALWVFSFGMSVITAS